MGETPGARGECSFNEGTGVRFKSWIVFLQPREVIAVSLHNAEITAFLGLLMSISTASGCIASRIGTVGDAKQLYEHESWSTTSSEGRPL